VIYVDTSVVLSHLFAEPKTPPVAFWSQPMTSSRLLHYETRNRIHVRLLAVVLARQVQSLLDQIILMDLSEPILARALQPFPIPVRTLDGLHLATMDFLRGHGQTIELATYDQRLALAATALGFPLVAM
jgi:predicted nucleic acid-binding protein